MFGNFYLSTFLEHLSDNLHQSRKGNDIENLEFSNI